MSAQHGRELLFEYAATFLDTGLALSPCGLEPRSGVQQETTGLFQGLHGLFHDSLPDGRGLRLMNRELARRGLHPATVSPLESLQCLGTRAMGGLAYDPVDRVQVGVDAGERTERRHVHAREHPRVRRHVLTLPARCGRPDP